MNICSKNKEKLSFDAKGNTEILKEYFTESTRNFLSKLPISANIFGISLTTDYYKNVICSTNKFYKLSVTVWVSNFGIYEAWGNDNNDYRP